MSRCSLRWLILGTAFILMIRCAPVSRPSSSADGRPSAREVLTPTPTPQLLIETIDELNASLPGVTVSVTYRWESGFRTFTCLTSNQGMAAFRGIPAETVDVTLSLFGFTDVRRTQIRLGAATTRLPVTLKLAPYDGINRVSSPIPVNVFGTPIWSPSPVPTPTPLPPDMQAIRCDRR